MSTTTDHAPTNLQVRHSYRASAERVFDAWLDPATLGQWLFATPTGEMVRIEIDARVGGRFIVVERRDGIDVEHVGEYLEINRPRRLVFTFGVPLYNPEMTTVAVDIAPTDSGCDLTLTHSGVPAEWQPQTTQGWATILAGLDASLAS